MDQYLPLVMLMVVAIGFAAGSFAASGLAGPKRRTRAKEGAYESGIVPRYGTVSRFPVKFYVVGMIFIIFDIEVVFLYPWAVDYVSLNTFGLAEMATFVLVVFVSFAYLLSNGALEWGPPKRTSRTSTIDQSRSIMGSVKRVQRPVDLLDSVSPQPIPDEQPIPHDAGPLPVETTTGS
jgi:NADH-quinone oxidoreductase subunit A